MHSRLYSIILALTIAHEAACASIPSAGTTISAPGCLPFPAPQAVAQINSETILTSPVDNGTDDSTEWPLEGPVSSSKARLRRALSDGAWLESISKGRALYGQLQRVVQDPAAVDATVCNLGERWDDRGAVVEPVGYPWNRAFKGRGMPAYGENAFYSWRVTAPKRESGRPVEYFYQNSYSAKYGLIKVQEINSLNALGERAPDRWSDITWALWKQLATTTPGSNPSLLKVVMVENTDNQLTKDTMDRAFTTQPPRLTPSGQPVPRALAVLGPQDDGFYALLSTPNVIGTVYMLGRNVNAIGRKTVAAISSFAINGKYYLGIVLKPAAGPESSTGAGSSTDIDSLLAGLSLS